MMLFYFWTYSLKGKMKQDKYKDKYPKGCERQ